MLRYGERCGFSPNWAENTLIFAAESGSPLALMPFVHSFDINHRLEGNQTALMLAAAKGRFSSVKMLIDEGADSLTKDNDNRTAEDIARHEGHTTVAALLRNHRSANWASIRSAESMVYELRPDSIGNELDEYESLLATEKFESLNSIRIDGCKENDELVWFKATKKCAIGLDHTGSITWMFDGLRANND